MRKLLLILTLPVLLFAVNYTSNSSGDWGTTTIWTPNGTPGAGDTISSIGHQVTTGGNRTIGTGGATGYSELIIASGGELIVETGDTLTIDRDFDINSGTLTMQSTSQITIDGTYEIEFTGTGTTFLNINGTAGSRCAIKAINGQSTSLTGAGGNDVINVDANYCNFIRFQDNKSFDFRGNSAYTQIINFNNCLFDSLSRIYAYEGNTPASNSELKFTNCDFRNSTNSFLVIIGDGNLYDFNDGTHGFYGCTVRGHPTAASIILVRIGDNTNKYQFYGNYLRNTQFLSQSNFKIRGGASFQDRGLQTMYDLQPKNLQGECDSILAYGSYTNIHIFTSAGTYGVDFSHNITWPDQANNGNAYLLSESASITPSIVEYCINRADNFIITRNAASPMSIVRYCTNILNQDPDGDCFFITEGSDTVNKLHSSINYHTGSNARILFSDSLGAITLSSTSYLDYNNIYDRVFAQRYWVTGFNTKTLGDSGYGGNDIAVDPQFINDTADIATWDTDLGGDGSIRNAFGEMFKKNGFDTLGQPSSYDTSYNYTNALVYFFNAYKPTNTDLIGAGLDGADIGAVSIAALPSIDSIVPDTGIDKGGFEVSIYGTGFSSVGGTANIGGDNITVSLWSDTLITGLAPAKTYNTYDVTVIDTAANQDVLTNGFRYIQTITDTVTIQGSGGGRSSIFKNPVFK